MNDLIETFRMIGTPICHHVIILINKKNTCSENAHYFILVSLWSTDNNSEFSEEYKGC